MQGRRAASALAFAGALALAGGALAQAPAQYGSHLEGDTVLVIAAGERVTVRLSSDGKLRLDSIRVATVVEAAPPKPGAKLGPRDGNPFIIAADGTIAFVLGQLGDVTMLKVENGTSEAFDYQAWMPKAGGGLEPTNVCSSLPLLAGYEQWPGRRLPRLVLNRFTPRATNSVDCPQPTGPPPAVPGP